MSRVVRMVPYGALWHSVVGHRPCALSHPTVKVGCVEDMHMVDSGLWDVAEVVQKRE